jgi:hypothetical protein
MTVEASLVMSGLVSPFQSLLIFRHESICAHIEVATSEKSARIVNRVRRYDELTAGSFKVMNVKCEMNIEDLQDYIHHNTIRLVTLTATNTDDGNSTADDQSSHRNPCF